MSNNNRVQIDEEVVGTIAGGRICYRGKIDGPRYLYSTDNPSAKYGFRADQFSEIGQVEFDCYGQSDEEIINTLLNKGLIWPM